MNVSSKPSSSVPSLAELEVTVQRMTERMLRHPAPAVAVALARYRALLPRFEADLGRERRDLALAQASALMLVQAIAQAEELTQASAASEAASEAAAAPAAPAASTSPGFRITRLQAEDIPRYRSLMLHAYAAAPDAFVATPEERADAPDAWWAARIADPAGNSLAFGAFDSDALVGSVTIEFGSRPKTRHKALLIGMFVREVARGRGIGRALVQHALAAAVAARPALRLVTLTVTQGNAAATGLYASCGFSVFGTEPMAIAMPDGFRAKLHMALSLPAVGPGG